MTPLKRLLDIAVATILLVLLFPLIVWIAVRLRVREGPPVLYLSERMKTPEKSFRLWKFRTMTVVEDDEGVSGGNKRHRITPTGKWLRRYRLDELPQLWNVLRGDISFIGPRPPLRSYVEQFPELYGEVLKSRPGVSGLATLAYHKTEERLLARCRTAEETEEVYTRRCVPRKARLDLIYARRRNVCWDMRLMFATIFRRVTIRTRKPR